MMVPERPETRFAEKYAGILVGKVIDVEAARLEVLGEKYIKEFVLSASMDYVSTCNKKDPEHEGV